MRETPLKHLVRRNSPDTSIEAAKSINVVGLELLVLEAIRKSKKEGMTADELMQAMPNLSYGSVTARPAALKSKGLIVDSGLRRTGRFGRKQIVLVATEFAPEPAK
jgi:hypothetical protein